MILILNKADSRQDTASVVLRIEKECGQAPVVVSAKEGTGIQGIFDAILEKLPENFGEQTITGNWVSEGDVVLLVMPQDIQAPKGRLILPQVQTIRELLDKKCLVMSCTTDKLQASLQALARPPKLIITRLSGVPHRLSTKALPRVVLLPSRFFLPVTKETSMPL